MTTLGIALLIGAIAFVIVVCIGIFRFQRMATVAGQLRRKRHQ